MPRALVFPGLRRDTAVTLRGDATAAAAGALLPPRSPRGAAAVCPLADVSAPNSNSARALACIDHLKVSAVVMISIVQKRKLKHRQVNNGSRGSTMSREPGTKPGDAGSPSLVCTSSCPLSPRAWDRAGTSGCAAHPGLLPVKLARRSRDCCGCDLTAQVSLSDTRSPV